MRFVGRQRELRCLNRFYSYHGAALLVLFAEPRVGKTYLLSHWLDRRKIPRVLFWTATTSNAACHLRDFSQSLTRFGSRLSVPCDDAAFHDWRAAFEYLAKIAEHVSKRVVIVIDEFTQLQRSHPPLSSVLQNVWDHRLSKLPNLRLVLTGSLLDIMVRDVLSYRAPLYGRATHVLRLRPLEYGILRDLFPDWSPEERVALHAVCGGMPTYLDLFSGSGSFAQGLRRCLKPGGMLGDPHLQLHAQVCRPDDYEVVLAAIATGARTRSDIARVAGVSEGRLGSRLRRLESLELIQRRLPVLAPPQLRNAHYHIPAPSLRFYYRSILPRMTAIERGKTASTARRLAREVLEGAAAAAFEELCRDWVLIEGHSGALEITPQTVGSFWTGRRDAVRLGVVGACRYTQQLFVGEAHWNRRPAARTVLNALIERSRSIPQVSEEGWSVQYGLFSRAGFTDSTVQAANGIGARLVTLPELEERLVEVAVATPRAPRGKLRF